ncbi:hypothetical protein NB640_11815 [Oxalobacter vibrioformis]|uniref:Uncharacterized protein n=1 Tax=Oxalobacter vibrioformis TaxID=933080 RepID=A0A9E9LW21_9BURK|nr:hypothetical protein [Oxalobacter vibrioformis]WAW09889.1 hypothetical protein NB640_11815 [Oxalobacter vibrioformis]
MNGLSQRNRTLGELLTELKSRMGFVAQGPASNNNNAVFTSFLQEAHDIMYAQLNPVMMRKKTVITLEPGSYLYDWHNDIEDEDIDPQLVQLVWIVDGNERYPLIQGISEGERGDASRSQPVRYETLNGQIELWPIPDRAYGLMVEYIASRPRFNQPSDRPGISDRLVFLYALSLAKSHYRHPDAQVAVSACTNLLRLEKVRQHQNRRYFINGGDHTGDGRVNGENGSYHYTPGGR